MVVPYFVMVFLVVRGLVTTVLFFGTLLPRIQALSSHFVWPSSQSLKKGNLDQNRPFVAPGRSEEAQ